MCRYRCAVCLSTTYAEATASLMRHAETRARYAPVTFIQRDTQLFPPFCTQHCFLFTCIPYSQSDIAFIAPSLLRAATSSRHLCTSTLPTAKRKQDTKKQQDEHTNTASNDHSTLPKQPTKQTNSQNEHTNTASNDHYKTHKRKRAKLAGVTHCDTSMFHLGTITTVIETSLLH